MSQEEQESELKAKYPGLAQKGAASMLLQKRLNRGHKFFDSGDYNMARAKTAQQKSMTEEEAIEKEEILQESTGVTIATPESVPTVRRKSMVEGLRSHRDSLIASEPSHHAENQ
ncbi:unnamed protein product [Hydatigera taeniaeformis]|uniref:cAMP-regulated phosphoprotein 19 n=1 Tax=Hydatigena taeniaeformis TaxID=6205 RepID=A0A0R3WHY9_HYDTA|nr:unnamed protein product [Hydatigera taeniaeformis]